MRKKIKNRKITAIAAIFLIVSATCLTACSNAVSAAKATDTKKEQVSQKKEIPTSNDQTLKNNFFKVNNDEMTNMSAIPPMPTCYQATHNKPLGWTCR